MDSSRTTDTSHRAVSRAARPHPFRRTQIAAVGVLIAAVATWTIAGAVNAATPVVPGEGNAATQTIAVIPKAGQLSIGVTLGESFAGHTNEEAKAQSQAIDLGAIGTSLSSINCNAAPTVPANELPQPVEAETGVGNSAQGISEAGDGSAVGSLDSAGFNRYAQATDAPYGKAVTSSGPISLAGVASIGGGTATSWSGIVNGEREAGATSYVSGITLPGGISLSGLSWSVLDESTGPKTVTGSFSIAGASIAGVPIPTNDPSSTLAQLNSVLEPLGEQLSPPDVHFTSGIEYVDPLELSVIPNATRDGLLNTILTGIQPVREDVFNALLQTVCQTDTAITVLDVALASISGGGTLNIILGGAQANSGLVPAGGFTLGGAGAPSLGGGSGGSPSLGQSSSGSPDLGGSDDSSSSSLGSPDPTAGDSGSAALPAATPDDSGSAITTTGSRGTTLGPVSKASDVKGKRGGALATVGLCGLGLIGLLAEGDRRKMRKAQRSVTFED
jgi:hypothetical protein